MEDQEKASVARLLADVHYLSDSGVRRIFWATESDREKTSRDDPIKLLLVNEKTCSVGVAPLRFGPEENLGITYPSVVIDVTPDEFEGIRAGGLKLPAGWEELEEFPEPPGRVDVDWKSLALDLLYATGEGWGWSGVLGDLPGDQIAHVYDELEGRHPESKIVIDAED